MRIHIPAVDNKAIPFLYNHAKEVMDSCKSGGTISNKGIVIERCTVDGLKKLSELEIKYFVG